MKQSKNIYILGIETSCDDTSAALLKGNKIISNFIANQTIHKNYGGVVPELASRAHQQNIIPVVDEAIKKANIHKHEIHAVGYTRGPGLLGSLLVGISFAKAFAMALGIPLIEVDHLQAHILAHFIEHKNQSPPEFPFLCLTVSGGHTMIVKVDDFFQMEIIGQTIDDAAGETFDKAAKIMGLPYPGGPIIDKYAQQGSPKRFAFAKPQVDALNFSFSGLKTSFLYFIRDELKKNENFIRENLYDLCAGMQNTIIDVLMEKIIKASDEYGIKNIAISGGVSANSGLRESLKKTAKERNWNIHIPDFQFTTDNAAMIAITAYYKYLQGNYSNIDAVPYSRIADGF